MSNELNKAPVEQAGGDERAAFEAWLAQALSKKFVPEFDLAKYEDSGEYRYSPAAAYWKAWQARAALAQPSPAQAEGFTHFPELLESVQQMDAMLKAEVERPEVVGSAWRNIYNNGFDHVAPFPPAPGGPVVDEPLMTVAQHAASVARWAEMFNRVEQERDAALARVAELDKQCRDDVARALGLRPSQERGFAWSYLLASIKSCVKASEDAAQAQHSVPEGWMIVECGIWTQEQVDEMQKTVARFRSSEFVDDRTLAMAVADAGQCKAPEISLAELLAAAPGKSVPQAWLDVLAERRRQITAEGWTPEHDDLYCAAELPRAAAAYILSGANDEAPAIWPFLAKWWKPRDARANYVRAGALILAEIERLDRAGAPGKEGL